jgi:two-component system chemotaxis response regulator CheY
MEEKKRILVADDSGTMRQLLKMMITKYISCEIVLAEDGQEALEKVEAGHFDLVVTDIQMPRMHGLAFVEKVRKEKKLDIPIIMVTTKGAEKDRDMGMELGANAYITKPVNGLKLADAIKALIS